MFNAEPNHEPHAGPYNAAVVWLTSWSRVTDTLASMESIAKHMPMNQPYPMIWLHDGELSGPIQDAIVDLWNNRSYELEGQGEVHLAKKMRKMIKYIEFPEVNMQIPDRLAARIQHDRGYEGIVVPERWPGALGIPLGLAMHRVMRLRLTLRLPLDVPILLGQHLLASPHSSIGLHP